MAISIENAISVLQLIFFFPGLTLSFWLCFQQGMKAVASCWRFVVILCLLRSCGAICSIIASSNPSEGIITTVIICDLLGLAPLTLMCVGLLNRVNQSANTIHKHFFTAVSLISLAGLGVGTAGASEAVKSNGPDTSYGVTGLLVAALAIFIGCFALMLGALALLSIVAWKRLAATAPSEVVVLKAVAFMVPFLLVRLVDAAIADFAQNQDFFFYGGDNGIYLIMSVTMEIIVTVTSLAVGYFVPPPPATMQNSENTENKKTAADSPPRNNSVDPEAVQVAV